MSTPVRHQPSDLHTQAIVVAALAVLLLIVLATALVRLVATLAGTPTAALTRRIQETPALSRPDARSQLLEYQRQQAARLDSYGWDDDGHRFAHIPLERAMQLLVQQPQLMRSTTPAPAIPAGAKPAPVQVPRAPERFAPLAPR